MFREGHYLEKGDFVVLKHGHESSQGVLIAMILIMSSTSHRTLNHHPFARKL